jgi:hypothetical protein
MNEVIHLFPSPVYKTSIAGHRKFKKIIAPKLLDTFNKEPDKRAPWALFCNTWQTDKIDSKDFEIISGDIESAIEKYLLFLQIPNVSYKYTGWFNVHDSKMYQELHNHAASSSILAGIYYIQFDKTQHRPVSFSNPNINFLNLLNSHNLNMYNPVMGPYRNIEIDVDEGDVLLFSSTLDHLVTRSPDAIDKRITLSFNVYLE